jgi:protein-S-isoprenylcysteine O-methyltransferase Ste14
MQAHLLSLLIIAIWIFIWIDLARCANSNHKPLPEKTNIKVVGVSLLIAIAGFYTTLYSASTFMYLAPLYIQLVCIGLLFCGAYLVVGARRQMSALTAREVLFSINTNYSAGGVFKKFTHPMFFGIGIILISSWCLLSNIIPGVLLLISLTLLCVKAAFETREIKKQLNLQESGIDQ